VGRAMKHPSRNRWLRVAAAPYYDLSTVDSVDLPIFERVAS